MRFILGLWLFFIAFPGAAWSSVKFGVFIADAPALADIQRFTADYGRKPDIVLLFMDWDSAVPEAVLRDIYSQGASVMLTWEPWQAQKRQGIDPQAILEGKYDAYIISVASALKKSGRQVYMRFAHEMNGNWYPWSAKKWGADKYAAVARYVHQLFKSAGASEVRWVFSINAQNVPADNAYADCYPGDAYVDFIGIDGYNWGNTAAWSQWRSFSEIFHETYRELALRYPKPLMITEFSTTGQGGDKSAWIRDAMQAIRRMNRLKAVILFNQDKETNWGFKPGTDVAHELRRQLKKF